MRLIDADALYEQAANTAENYCGFFNEMEKVISARNIEQAPTIDAAPVAHGKWVQTSTYHLRHGDGIVSEACCSVCEMYSYQMSPFPYVGYDYCPRCGAKMDGGADNG